MKVFGRSQPHLHRCSVPPEDAWTLQPPAGALLRPLPHDGAPSWLAFDGGRLLACDRHRWFR